MQTQIHSCSLQDCQIDIFHFRGLDVAFKPHFHESLMLGCLVSGEHRLIAPGIDSRIGPFDLVVLTPYSAHACHSLSSRKAEWISVQISAKHPTLPNGRSRIYPSTDPAARLAHSLVRLADMATPSPCALEALRSAAFRLAASLPAQGNDRQDPGFAAQGERLTLEEMATAAGMDKFSYLRRFRAAQGITPVRCETNLRLNLAQGMLRRGEGIAASAYACGFCDQGHFARRFKASLGVTPGQYREAWQK